MLPLAADDEFIGFAATLSHLELDGLDKRLQVRHLKVPTRALYAIWRAGNFLPVEKFTGDVDLFHATNYFLPPTRIAKRVVTIHDLSFMVVPQYCSPRIVRPFAAGINAFAHDSDRIIAYSESTKKDIVSILGVPESKISVIHMAVDDEFGSSPEDADWLERTHQVGRPYVLFVGMLEPRMMHARTPVEFGEVLRWMHVPLATLVVAFVWFIRLYLGAGRAWMAWSITGLRVLTLVPNFLSYPNATFQEITGLRQAAYSWIFNGRAASVRSLLTKGRRQISMEPIHRPISS